MSDLYSSGGKFQKGGTGRGKKRSNPVVKILMAVVAVLFSVVVGLGYYGWQVSRAEAEFDRLAAMTQTEAVTPSAAQTPQTTNPVQESQTEAAQTEADEATQPSREVLPQYAQLYEENPEIWGWLTIPDTKVDYPVMHTPQEPEKYLYADFYGNYSFPGTPFLDAQCTSESDNLLIYGHNMKNGSMFRSILKYGTVTYAKAHPSFQLNTLYEEREYQVLAAFYDRVYYSYEDCFKFYRFINAADQEEFDNALAEIKSKALYDTGVTVEYGDQLVMLVTCSAHTDNGRFVLVGCYHPTSAEE